MVSKAAAVVSIGWGRGGFSFCFICTMTCLCVCSALWSDLAVSFTSSPSQWPWPLLGFAEAASPKTEHHGRDVSVRPALRCWMLAFFFSLYITLCKWLGVECMNSGIPLMACLQFFPFLTWEMYVSFASRFCFLKWFQIVLNLWVAAQSHEEHM